ncbi:MULTISPECIES: hypothetical protein [Sphingobacterium]|uniref:Uncharacterized protein n=1 Tax=Sphingobacterium populi TaxID=1812824 RepID=A0ABW5U7Z1_9SPHI|nr:hypothetical protein [Sphingobacterium sp. CFCC 11742]
MRIWLKNPDYESGVRLYSQFGTNEFLKNIFQQGESDYTRSKLVEELSGIIGNSGISGNSDPISKPELPHRDNSFLLKKLRHERQQIYRQIDANMFALTKARSESVLKETAFQILRLQSRKQETLDKIDHLELHGTLPEKAEKPEFTTPEIQRLYVQIWKTRKRLEKPELRNREQTQQLLKSKLELLDELRKEAANG